MKKANPTILIVEDGWLNPDFEHLPGQRSSACLLPGAWPKREAEDCADDSGRVSQSPALLQTEHSEPLNAAQNHESLQIVQRPIRECNPGWPEGTQNN
jgi:hypothetical protein